MTCCVICEGDVFRANFWFLVFGLRTEQSKFGVFSFECSVVRRLPDSIPISKHVGGVQALLGDGSVRFLSENMSWQVLLGLLTPNGGEVVGEF